MQQEQQAQQTLNKVLNTSKPPTAVPVKKPGG